MGKFTYQAWRYVHIPGLALPRQNTRIGARFRGHEFSYPRTRYSARVKDQDDSLETCFPKTLAASVKAKCMTTLRGHDGDDRLS